MKFSLAFAIAIIAISCVSSFPLDEDSPVNEDSLQEHVRVRRFTCDVLGVEIAGVKLNHAACASHCLTLKKRGGYCNGKGVCVCR